MCDILAVSRAFGDWEFKGKGLPTLLTKGVSLGYFDAKFAAGVKFTGDPVIATPDIVQARAHCTPVYRSAGPRLLSLLPYAFQERCINALHLCHPC